MQFKVTPKGNSRFLYVDQSVSDLDISLAITDIDSKIDESTQLQLATTDTILIFGSLPKSDDFFTSNVKIGREIIGFDSNVFSVLKYKDFSQRDVNQIDIEAFRDWKSLVASVEDLVKSKNWRVVISHDFSKWTLEDAIQ